MLDLKVKQFIIATVILCCFCYFQFYLLGFFFWTFGFVVFEDSLDVSEEDDEEFEVFLIDPGNEFDLLEFKAQMRGFRIDDLNDNKLTLLLYWQNIKRTSKFYNFEELIYGGDFDERIIDFDDNKILDVPLEAALSGIIEKKVQNVRKHVKKKKKIKKSIINKYFF